MKRTLLATTCLLAGTPALAASQTDGALGLVQQYPDLFPKADFETAITSTISSYRVDFLGTPSTGDNYFKIDHATSASTYAPQIKSTKTLFDIYFNTNQIFLNGFLTIKDQADTTILLAEFDSFAFDIEASAMTVELSGIIRSSSINGFDAGSKIGAIGSRFGISTSDWDLAASTATSDNAQFDIFAINAVPAPAASFSGLLGLSMLTMRRRRH